MTKIEYPLPERIGHVEDYIGQTLEIKYKLNSAVTQLLREGGETVFDTNNDPNDIPIPSSAIIDHGSISEWIDAEPDSRFKSIKMKLIEHLNYIGFLSFRAKLGECIERFNREIDCDYAVMWDYKPHASKRWVFKLIENKLSRKPSYSNFFHPSAEKVAIKTVDKLHDQKVSKFVIVDDSAYSGEQIFNRFLIPILEKFKLNYPSEKPEFYVIVPFITNSFKEKVKKFTEETDCKVNLNYSQVMPQVRDILTIEELKLMDNERNGSIEVHSHEPLYRDLTLTFFDHRVADDHSFSPEIARVIKVQYEKPYRRSDTKYSIKEEDGFNKYWELYTKEMNNKE